MAAILRKAAAYADHLDMHPPVESTTWTSMLWEHYWRQRLAVCLVNYSYRMRSLIFSPKQWDWQRQLLVPLKPSPTLDGDVEDHLV
jgi:hypothetical protein